MAFFGTMTGRGRLGRRTRVVDVLL